MVDRSDHTKYRCNDLGQLYCTGNKFEWMFEFAIQCNNSYGKCLTGYTDDYSLRTYDLLQRR